MSDALRDVRYAARSLLKTPAFTLLAIVTIALGVGANTAVFSMIRGVLLRRLPYAGDARLVRITQPSATNPDVGFSIPELADYRAQVGAFASVAEYHSMPFQLYGHGEPRRVQTGVVSDGFFGLLGVHPLMGRLFLPGEGAIGAPPVVVLSYRFWREQMASDPDIVGTTFTMNDHVHTVVGVLPPLPAYPGQNDIWMPAGACPFRSSPQTMSSRRARLAQAFALVKDGVAPDRASGDLQLVARRLREIYPEAYPAAAKLSVALVPLREELTRASRPLFVMLLATATFVLLVAAANFASLTLARQLRRGAEMALRTALGAGPGRMFRQLATESLCLTLTGGALGVLIAYSSLGLLRALATRVTPRAGEISIDLAVLGFALGISIAVGLAAAMVPLMRRDRDAGAALRAGAVATTAGRRDGALRNALVGAQVALAFVVLVGAGLVTRSLIELQRVDGGYDVRNVLTARVDLDWTRYTNATVVQTFADQLTERLSREAGMSAVALASDFPLNNGQPSSQPFVIFGRETGPDAPAPTSDVTVVGPSYFRAIGVPVLRGRVFDPTDRDTANIPAVISRRLAEAHWPDRDPVGERISINNGRSWITIVGVVGDVHQTALSLGTVDEIYLPYAVFPSSDVRVLMRSSASPRAVAAALRETVRALDDKQPVVQVQTLEELRGVRLAEPRLTSVLLVSFALLSLIITAGGLGGVVAYAVSQRTAEIGIRMALGATARHVLWAVTRGGLTVVLIGLALGIGASLVTGRLVERLLFAVTPTDATTYAAVGTLLLGVAMLACALPARRATRISPLEALRSQ